MVHYFRRRLRWKLFFSYLAVVLVGAMVLIAAMEIAVPRAFARHLATIEAFTGGSHVMDPDDSAHLVDDLFVQFRTAVNEATLIATAIAGLVAVTISALISRRVIAPVREMMHASRQIAQGNYGRRVIMPDHRPPADRDEMLQSVGLAERDGEVRP